MRFLSAVVLVLSALSGTTVAASASIEELVLGPADKGGAYIISPRGGRVAYAGAKGTRVRVIVDGVEGPEFDELFSATGQSFFVSPNLQAFTATTGGRTPALGLPPVIMSPDGSHWAFAGRQGDDYVVIHDGKEVGRGPRPKLGLDLGPLTLSPNGNHVHWVETNGPGVARHLYRLMLNGNPGPWSAHQDMVPVFSPDERRYFYTLVDPDDGQKRPLVIDGTVVGYPGHNPVFTADGKHVITQFLGGVGDQGLFVDGTLRIRTRGLRKVLPAPVGGGYAAIALKETSGGQGVYMLYIDGKEIPGTEDALEVWYSPDGKHHAVACENKKARAMYLVVDGKKQREYQGINTNVPPAWFADNARLIYLVTANGRSFVVVDGEEQPIGYLGAGKIITVGPHYAYHTYDGSNTKHSLIINGKEALVPGYYPRGVGFTAEGTRHAYPISKIGRSDITGFVVDGKIVEGFSPTHDFLFSPNGMHLAVSGGYGDRQTHGLYIDGKLTYPTAITLNNLTFTPDSDHLAWLTSDKFPDRPRPYITVYMDGEQLLKLDRQALLLTKGSWDMGKDGTLTVVEIDGNEAKRFRITPAADMTVAKWVESAGSRRAAAQAQQAATQKQAAEDTAAAKAQADADRAAAAAKAKADAESAAAKRKADYEAAVAAKQKARAEALEAKRQARLLQLENAKRKRQGLPPLTALPK